MKDLASYTSSSCEILAHDVILWNDISVSCGFPTPCFISSPFRIVKWESDISSKIHYDPLCIPNKLFKNHSQASDRWIYSVASAPRGQWSFQNESIICQKGQSRGEISHFEVKSFRAPSPSKTKTIGTNGESRSQVSFDSQVYCH
jgi:hypothetical protein